MFLVVSLQTETNIYLICDVYQMYVDVINANNNFYNNLFAKRSRNGNERQTIPAPVPTRLSLQPWSVSNYVNLELICSFLLFHSHPCSHIQCCHAMAVRETCSFTTEKWKKKKKTRHYRHDCISESLLLILSFLYFRFQFLC